MLPPPKCQRPRVCSAACMLKLRTTVAPWHVAAVSQILMARQLRPFSSSSTVAACTWVSKLGKDCACSVGGGCIATVAPQALSVSATCCCSSAPAPCHPPPAAPAPAAPTAPACRSTAARFPGVQFRGRNSSFSCGTADNYEECYRECGCWRTRNQCSPPPPPSPADAPPSPPPAPAAPCGNAPEVACNYVVFSPNDTRCAADGSQNMCVYLSTVTGADAAPALQSGIYGNVDRLSLDGEQRLDDPEP